MLDIISKIVSNMPPSWYNKTNSGGYSGYSGDDHMHRPRIFGVAVPQRHDISLDAQSRSLVCFIEEYCLHTSNDIFLPWVMSCAEDVKHENAHKEVVKILSQRIYRGVKIEGVFSMEALTDMGSYANGTMIPGADSDHDILVTLPADFDNGADYQSIFNKWFAELSFVSEPGSRILRLLHQGVKFDVVLESLDRDIYNDEKKNVTSIGTFLKTLAATDKLLITRFIRACKYWIMREVLPLRSFITEGIAQYLWVSSSSSGGGRGGNLSFFHFLSFLQDKSWDQLPPLYHGEVNRVDQEVLSQAGRQGVHLLRAFVWERTDSVSDSVSDSSTAEDGEPQAGEKGWDESGEIGDEDCEGSVDSPLDGNDSAATVAICLNSLAPTTIDIETLVHPRRVSVTMDAIMSSFQQTLPDMAWVPLPKVEMKQVRAFLEQSTGHLLKSKTPGSTTSAPAETVIGGCIIGDGKKESVALRLAGHYLSISDYKSAFECLHKYFPPTPHESPGKGSTNIVNADGCGGMHHIKKNYADAWYMKGLCAEYFDDDRWYNGVPQLVKEIQKDQMSFALKYLSPRSLLSSDAGAEEAKCAPQQKIEKKQKNKSEQNQKNDAAAVACTEKMASDVGDAADTVTATGRNTTPSTAASETTNAVAAGSSVSNTATSNPTEVLSDATVTTPPALPAGKGSQRQKKKACQEEPRQQLLVEGKNNEDCNIAEDTTITTEHLFGKFAAVNPLEAEMGVGTVTADTEIVITKGDGGDKAGPTKGSNKGAKASKKKTNSKKRVKLSTLQAILPMPIPKPCPITKKSEATKEDILEYILRNFYVQEDTDFKVWRSVDAAKLTALSLRTCFYLQALSLDPDHTLSLLKLASMTLNGILPAAIRNRSIWAEEVKYHCHQMNIYWSVSQAKHTEESHRSFAKYKLTSARSATNSSRFRDSAILQKVHWAAEMGCEEALRGRLTHYTELLSSARGFYSDCFLLTPPSDLASQGDRGILLPTMTLETATATKSAAIGTEATNNETDDAELREKYKAEYFKCVYNLSGFRHESDYLYLLGSCYAEGFGVQRDLSAGHRLHEYVAAQRRSLENEILSYLDRSRSVDALVEGRKCLKRYELYMAKQWLQLAIGRGQHEAYYDLSVLKNIYECRSTDFNDLKKAALGGHVLSAFIVYCAVEKIDIFSHIKNAAPSRLPCAFVGASEHELSEKYSKVSSKVFSYASRTSFGWSPSCSADEKLQIQKVAERHSEFFYAEALRIISLDNDEGSKQYQDSNYVVQILEKAATDGGALARIHLACLLITGERFHVKVDLVKAWALLLDTKSTIPAGFPPVQLLLANCYCRQSIVLRSNSLIEKLLDSCFLYNTTNYY